MRVRASIGLTIDITSEKEMGLDIDDNEIENYVIENFVEYLHTLIKTYDVYDVINVERVKELV